MKQLETWIVAPNYLAMMCGFEAVAIGVRKAHLMNGGKRVLSCFYKQGQLGPDQSFTDMVDYITTNTHLQEQQKCRAVTPKPA